MCGIPERVDLLQTFKEEKRKYDKCKSENKRYRSSLRNNRDKASKRLQAVKRQHKLSSNMDSLTHEQRVDLVIKYKALYEEYNHRYDKAQDLMEESFGDMSERDIAKAMEKLNEHLESHLNDAHEPLTQIIDAEAASFKEHPLWLCSSHGGKYKWNGDRWKKQDLKIHENTGEEKSAATDNQKRFFKYDCKICLWEDHYFALEGEKTLRTLINENKLKPMSYSANYIFSNEFVHSCSSFW